MSNSHHDYEELALTSTTGLQAVFHNVQQLYQRGLSTEAEQLIPSSAAEGTAFHTAYRRVRATLESLIEVVEKGQSVSAEAAAKLQQVYDAFVAAEAALATYVPKRIEVAPAPVIEASTPAPAPTLQPAPVIPTKAAPPAPTAPVTPPTKAPLESSTHAPLSARTSKVLSVTEADQSAAPAKKKKRRRKKNRQPTGPAVSVTDAPVPHTTETAPVELSYGETARALLQKIAALSHIDAATVTTARSLVEEVEMATRHLSILHNQSNIAHRDERLAHHRTAAEMAIAELEVLVLHAGYNEPDAPVRAEAAAAVTSTIPITTTAVVSQEATKGSPRVSFVPTTITTKTTRPVPRTIPKQLVSLQRPDAIHEAFSLTATYLTAPKYQEHIAAHYSDAAAFERLLDASITTLESATIDGIERWLGDTPASAFDFVKDMSLESFTTFATAGYQTVTDALRAENIKYETFLVWRDLYDDMIQVISPTNTMTYGELFARFMIEEDIASLEGE